MGWLFEGLIDADVGDGQTERIHGNRGVAEPERGYLVLSRTTEAGSVIEVKVTELSTAPLDPALFDVPAGFVCVEQIRQEPVPPLVIRLKQAYERIDEQLPSQ